MKHYLLAAFLCCMATGLCAKNPSWLKKARRAQVTVIAFDKEGTPHESQGVFVDRQGTVLTEYDIFRQATRAVVLDCNGTEHPVSRIMGANSMYNVAKVKAQMQKSKVEMLLPDTTPIPQGGTLYLLPTAKADKKVPCTADTVRKEERFRDSYHYYTLSRSHSQRLASCPVLNEQGGLTGLLQMASKEGDPSAVISAHFAASLAIKPMDAANADLRAILIPKALPAEAQDAASYIFLSGAADSLTYLALVDDYLQQWPDSLQGHLMKAEALAQYQRYAEADQAYEAALALASANRAEVYYSRAKTIYGLNLQPGLQLPESWTMEQALVHIEHAIQAQDMPIYRKQKADCLYALKRYAEARDIYIALGQTNLRSADLFLYAAQCWQMEDENRLDQMIALQDSALACYAKPYPAEAAPILLMRANNLARAEKHRLAVADLIVYEHTYKGILSAEFFYQREQLALKCRMYPTALSDIGRAIRLNPQEPVFRAEMAALCFRLDQVDEAILAAQAAVNLDAKFADAYRILGACYTKKGDTKQARTHLQKAVDLGDTIAVDMLKGLK